ncbi:RRXRR domain-containing protein [Microcystis aeruginosa CS-338/01]|uniref:RRXRR domain-containing protein n=1 Tax=Microcystis aeruginosa TaxID=1126 RepID=UPI00232AA01C|nr:RRXRR domain-containing protein [Microcystis aeruginosa]MDB9509524.1 RRXRR domain-containing protein [Microcystis aeruginosa CS-338/01]
MERVPVISKDGKPLMPTKPSRARRWIKEGKAIGKFNDLDIFYVQLTDEPSDNKTQPIAIGIDPGKLFSGIGVQSSLFTLWKAHLELPFKRVKERMDNRRLMRKGRRGRRINRQLSFDLRAHRQKRFSNRKQGKLAPSIRANRQPFDVAQGQLELRVVSELTKIYPITDIYFEYIKADIDLTSGRKGAKSGKGFSSVMVGQKWAIEQLSQLATVHTRFGWQTSNLRKHLRLEKSKNKAEQSPESHANDGIALVCFQFLDYWPFQTYNSHGYDWKGSVEVTNASFAVIKRPPISRRQLHLIVFSKGGKRLKYGGSTTRHGFRKGDLVSSPKGIGYISGDTEKQLSVSDTNGQRLGQIAVSKIQLIRRSDGLIVSH